MNKHYMFVALLWWGLGVWQFCIGEGTAAVWIAMGMVWFVLGVDNEEEKKRKGRKSK